MNPSETSLLLKESPKTGQVSGASLKPANHPKTISPEQRQIMAPNSAYSSRDWSVFDWHGGLSSKAYSSFGYGGNASHHTNTDSKSLLPTSGFDLQERLLNLQPRPGTFEAFRERPQWENSFPPAAYYITPPTYTPEEPLMSPSSIIRDVRQSSNRHNDSPQRDLNHYDSRQAFATPALTSVLSPAMEDYHLGQTDIEQETLALMEAQHNREPPYAELLHKCLSKAPGNQMILKDIYDWFKANTDKASNPEAKGWMNSIRHNLSMNQGFEKIEQSSAEDGRRGYVWKLSEKALRDGIQSTTRYRKKPPSGKHGSHKGRRNSIAGVNRVTKREVRRPTRIQTDFLDDGNHSHYQTNHLDSFNQDNIGVSPGSCIAASPPTPRGFVALPSGIRSPLIPSIHSPDWVAYDPMSPFSPTTDIPRSNPYPSLKYSVTSAPNNQPPPPPDFRPMVHDANQPHDGQLSVLNHAYGGAEQWEGVYFDGSVIPESMQPLDRAFSTFGGGLFSAPNRDAFSMGYVECAEPNGMFLVDG